jgi:hypothetical protein
MFDSLYPVLVKTDLLELVEAGIYHHDGLVRVFTRRGGGIELVLEGLVVDYERKSSLHQLLWVQRNGEQEVWDLRPQGGCGCSSPLSTFSVEEAFAWTS